MKFEETILATYPTGSNYICNPPVVDTDIDTVVLVNGYYDYRKMLAEEGWGACAKENYVDGTVYAVRKGLHNYIVVEDPDIFNDWVVATEAARALNLTKKEDRVTLFKTIKTVSQDRRWAATATNPAAGIDFDGILNIADDPELPL